MDPPFLSLLFYTVKEISFHLCPGSYSTLHSQENLIYDSLFNALSLSLSVDAETSTEVQVSPNLHKKNKKCLSDNHFLQVSDKFQNVYTVSISSSALQGWVDKPLTKLRSGVKGRYGPLTPGVCNSSAGQAISLQPPLLFAGALAPPWICPGTHILQSLRDCKNLKTAKNLRGDPISPPWPP